MSDSKPVVYVVVLVQWPAGDVSGSLVSPDHGVLFSHLSSNVGWLQSDLTTRFRERRQRLEDLFPDGYDVQLIRAEDDLPDSIAELFISEGASDE